MLFFLQIQDGTYAQLDRASPSFSMMVRNNNDEGRPVSSNSANAARNSTSFHSPEQITSYFHTRSPQKSIFVSLPPEQPQTRYTGPPPEKTHLQHYPPEQQVISQSQESTSSYHLSRPVTHQHETSTSQKLSLTNGTQKICSFSNQSPKTVAEERSPELFTQGAFPEEWKITHCHLEKVAVILKMIFSIVFSWLIAKE